MMASSHAPSALADLVRSTARNTATTIQTAVHGRVTHVTQTAVITIMLGLVGLSQPVLAQPEGCNPPSDLQPVFDLLEAITQVTMMGGLTIAALGIALGGVFFMWPGQDNNRRAKSTITYTIIGTVIILSAHAIVAFVTSQMATPIC